MSDELVRRLQHLGDWQAADRIEALKARVVELERALRDLMLPQTPASFAGSMRVARAALAEGKG